MRIVTLSSGQRVLVRPIRPSDKAELQRGLARLSAETVHRRFLAAKPRFSRAELSYFTEVDGRNHIALVAVEIGAPFSILASARAVRLPDEPGTAEWAIVVADELQGLGLGRAMIGMLADLAREAGIERFTATMLSDNEPVHRLLAHVHGRLEHDERLGSVHQVTHVLAA